MVENHTHNKTDSPGLFLGECVVNAPQEAITQVSGTAGATYTATEQAMFNDLKTKLNTLLTTIQTLGLIK